MDDLLNNLSKITSKINFLILKQVNLIAESRAMSDSKKKDQIQRKLDEIDKQEDRLLEQRHLLMRQSDE